MPKFEFTDEHAKTIAELKVIREVADQMLKHLPISTFPDPSPTALMLAHESYRCCEMGGLEMVGDNGAPVKIPGLVVGAIVFVTALKIEKDSGKLHTASMDKAEEKFAELYGDKLNLKKKSEPAPDRESNPGPEVDPKKSAFDTLVDLIENDRPDRHTKSQLGLDEDGRLLGSSMAFVDTNDEDLSPKQKAQSVVMEKLIDVITMSIQREQDSRRNTGREPLELMIVMSALTTVMFRIALVTNSLDRLRLHCQHWAAALEDHEGIAGLIQRALARIRKKKGQDPDNSSGT